MAAGNTLLVKLRYRSRPSFDCDSTPISQIDIRQSVMASTPELELEEMSQPALDMELPSTDSLSTSLEHGNPISISIPPAPMMPLATSSMLSASQRRRRKSSVSLKRSASTPNVRGHHNSDAGMTLAEKRRNKLGYHRISVACGAYLPS